MCGIVRAASAMTAASFASVFQPPLLHHAGRDHNEANAPRREVFALGKVSSDYSGRVPVRLVLSSQRLVLNAFGRWSQAEGSRVFSAQQPEGVDRGAQLAEIEIAEERQRNDQVMASNICNPRNISMKVDSRKLSIVLDAFNFQNIPSR
ncbi:hypothetical protein [Streptomyces sp. NPDC048419]|uniref:hypothetical protein n=1 Tax=Streptomyces sp. NPDC048419 TaxID=3365547 RepID=UPI00371475A2